MGTMEDQIRKIVREEIARAFSAAEEVADNAVDAYTEETEIFALQSIRGVMRRVARDVLANTHPALEPEHTASTPSTELVHTITAVPERARAACTCVRHTHVMGNGDRCGAPHCYCLSPVRARAEHTPEHTPEHASTEPLDYNRPCTVCEHGEHDQGKCSRHVYLRGVASPCPCLASRTLGAQASTEACSCPGGHRKAVNGQCQMCGHKAHNPADCTGKRSFE